MTWGSSRNNEQQVEQLSKEMQIFQNNVLNKMQEIAKSIEKERSRTHDVYMNVIYLKDEMRQVRKQVDTLVTHLLMPDPPLQKIKEAISEIKNYRDILQEKQQVLDSINQTFTRDMMQIISALSSIISLPQRNTDSIPSIDISSLDEKEVNPDEMMDC